MSTSQCLDFVNGSQTLGRVFLTVQTFQSTQNYIYSLKFDNTKTHTHSQFEMWNARKETKMDVTFALHMFISIRDRTCSKLAS